MAAYTRPPLQAPVIRDEDGQVIPCGHRWDSGSPPEDSYSRVSHPERFAPLHRIAEALISHLTENYDARLENEDEPVRAMDPVPTLDNVIRVARLTPRKPDEAPLTFIFTAFPGVSIQAGLLYDHHFPECGCDACDETWSEQADELERLVLTVVAGGFAEWCRSGLRPRFGSSLTAVDGSGTRSSETRAGDIAANRFAATRKRLRALSDGWSAWSLRS